MRGKVIVNNLTGSPDPVYGCELVVWVASRMYVDEGAGCQTALRGTVFAARESHSVDHV